MAAGCELALAGGLWRDGRCERRVVLRALDGEQERALLERLADALPAERVTGLLAPAVQSIGSVAPVTADDLRELAVGDRDRLVLALRGLALGDALDCVFTCGNGACGETLELALRVSDLIADETGAERSRRELSGATPAGGRLTVRPVTGADHERAARRALDDPGAAAAELVAVCVVDAVAADGTPLEPSAAPAADVAALLAALDPAAELLLAGECPACGGRVEATLDPITHLWAELEQRRGRLEHEVHVLASSYHWSEREIIALPDARRRRYLALVDHEWAGP
jgi:hypothetical protein